LFAKVYIDIMHMSPANGFSYIVAAKDNLSGTSEAAGNIYTVAMEHH